MTVMSLGNVWLPRITSRTLYKKLMLATMSTTVLLSIILPQYTDDIPMRTYFHRMIHENGETYDVITPTDTNRGGPLFDTLSAPSEWEGLDMAECGDRSKIYAGGITYPVPVHEFVRHNRCRKAKNMTYDTFPYKKAEVKYTNVDDVDRGNKLTIDVQLHDASQIVVILPGTVTEWSLDHEVPPARSKCKCHFILFVHGGISVQERWNSPWTRTTYEPMRSDRRWQLRVTNATVADVQAHYLDFRKIVPHFEDVIPEDDLRETSPSWVSPVISYSQHLPSFRELQTASEK